MCYTIPMTWWGEKIQDEERLQHRLGDFDSVLKVIEFLIPHDKYAIIGGMAVELWRRKYAPQIPELKSKDLDACSHHAAEHAPKLTEHLGGYMEVRRFDDTGITVHKIHSNPDGTRVTKKEEATDQTLLLELVEPFKFVAVFEAPPEGIIERMPYKDPAFVNVIDPLSVFYAKFCIRVADLGKGWGEPKSFSDHDWDHLEILGKIIPAYLKDAAERYKKGALKKNPAILAKRLQTLLGDEQEVASGLFEKPQKEALIAALGNCIATLGEPGRISFSGPDAFSIGQGF